MKKLILPLLLLVAFGMLAAVESDPSDVVGYVKYILYAGDNDIALPLAQGYTNASGVGNDITDCTSVKYFDGATQLWVAANKAPFPPFPWGPVDFPVADGDPLLINTTTAGTFYSIGDLPDPLATYTLYAGDNFIMVPLDQSALNLASLIGNDITGCTSVKYFDGATQLWVAANKAPFPPFPWGPVDFTTAIGDALLINTGTAGTWPGAKLSK
ncbi:MAG: hypothetical protein LHW57_05700 [Candidatus Cloacimonetes bacterium]|nr:hypothetical protein [Candidatus Cloacimonadota bacterium]